MSRRIEALQLIGDLPLNRRLSGLAIGLLVLLLPAARASIREVDPGEVRALGADEGYLVVDVDSSDYIGVLRISKQGSLTGGENIKDLQAGQTRKLFVVTAGAYRWNDIHYLLGNMHYQFDLKNDEQFHFQVKPGIINYPGDLNYRPIGTERATTSILNRGLEAMDWLQATHPVVWTSTPFLYTGPVPDPFPDFYRAQRLLRPDRTTAELEKTLPPPAVGKLPIAIDDLWRETRIESVSLNPRGNLVAEAIHDAGSYQVDLIDPKARTSIRLLNFGNPVAELTWVGERVLAITLGGTAESTVYIVHIGVDGKPPIGYRIPRSGRLVDPLQDDPEHVLFGILDSKGSEQVNRIDISSAEKFDHHQFRFEDRLNHGLADVAAWLTDAHGQLRAAVAKQGSEFMLFHGTDGHYQSVLTFNKDNEFTPMGMSADGSLLYGLSDKGRGQKELVVFDPTSKSITKTLFSKPGVDISAPVFDAQRNPIGVAYYVEGKRVVDYFDQDNRVIDQRIAKAFPGMSAQIIDRDATGKQFLLAVAGSNQPGQLYYLDLAHATASLLDEDAPWLTDKPLAPSQTLHVNGPDGLPIEAYLTLPVHVSGKVPLIVYTHGGPIGVRDRLGFDPAVQLFASLGFGVLQVNYRGSSGYGRTFRDAGRRHYGSLIEDDIDAATREALGKFPLDATRVCAVGASYGGYSALVQSIRWPQRFRCVVSISGVTDQMLMFSASDVGRTAASRKEFAELIGDPQTDGETMKVYSPIYRYKEIKVPVMLAHGLQDRRVDYENTSRMVRMLNLAGKTPVAITFKDEGHGGFDNANAVKLWTGVAGFLRANLDAAPPVPPTPTANH